MQNTAFPQMQRPRFTGHETFTLRYGWLKKACDAIADDSSAFLSDDAVAQFGVGKNMVSSIRHWASAAGVIEQLRGQDVVTPLGERLFGDDGLDPYMENPSSLWLVHWNLSRAPDKKTTWFWVFNRFHEIEFERAGLERRIQKFAEDQGWKRVSPSTIKRDVACFIGTYAPRVPSAKSTLEDAMESPLIELGLLKRANGRDRFRLSRGPKRSLGVGAFGFALARFWREKKGGASSLSFASLMNDPGSPGRIFLLDENSLFNLCELLEEVSGGVYRWSETAGLRQMFRSEVLDERHDFEMLWRDYATKEE